MRKMAIFAIAMLASVALFSGITSANSISDISTDKQEYLQGEGITITITNNCRGTLTMKGYSILDEKGENVYSPPMLADGITLEAGDVFVDVWMQNLDTGKMAAPGIYAVDNEYDSVKITILAPVKPMVDISTDQPIYVFGEEVLVSLTNTGDECIACPGYWVEDSNGKTIYTPDTLLYVKPIIPGESVAFTWSQTDDSGSQVGAGTYFVCTAQDRTEIAIFEGARVEVAADQAVYDFGECVFIVLTNTGDLPTLVSNEFIVETQNGKVIYTPDMLAFMRPLYVGASIEFTWDQVDDEGNQVDPGTYTIVTSQGSVTIEVGQPGHFEKIDNHGRDALSADAFVKETFPPDFPIMPKPVGTRNRF